MDSQKLRTYGKRSGIKRKQDSNLSVSDRVIASVAVTNTTPAKRRKVSSQTAARDLSPTHTEVVSETEPDAEEQAFLGFTTAKVTYTPSRNPVKSDAKSSFPQPQFPAKGAKLARDLSGILDAIAPATPSSSPTKLAKRMLARSKTDSSIASQSTTREFPTIDRTPSLPTIPSSPSRTREIVASTSKLAPPVHPLLPASSKHTTRTYAGQFRSFLVTVPPPNSQTINEEDEFDTRESYSSLRSRWDVDNSEDDPYPYASPSPSKSKSNSATPDMSPSRSGKGKSRATITAARPPPIPYGMSNPLKSISELRNKGESRRFLDEVGYLFEGMDKQGGLGLRRASALEITTKLCDPDFARKAKAADFFTRTWDLFLDAGAGKGEEKILDTLLVFFVALVARDPVSLLELTQRPPSPPPSPLGPSRLTEMKDKDLSFFDALFNILDSNSSHMDPLILIAPNSSFADADLKKGGIRAKDRTLLTTIYKTISSKSNLFSEDTIISTSLLVAFILQTLPPSIIPSQHFTAFLSSLRLSLCPIASPSLTSTLSHRWLNAAKAIPYNSIHYHLQLLDTYLLEQWSTHQEEPSQKSFSEDGVAQLNDEAMLKAREDWLAEDLVAFAVCIELNKTNEEPDSFPARKYLDATLRILVSLTHMDKLWARKVAQGNYTMGLLMRTIHGSGQELQRGRVHLGGVVKKEEDDELPDAEEEAIPGKADSQALDTLCLALGLLTNLVQSVGEAKDAVREIQLKPSCSLKNRACGRQCTCSQRSSGIEILVQLYTQQQTKIESSSATLSEDSPEARAEADASFLRGHLAVLFGLLMMGSAANETAILSSLPSFDVNVKKAALVARRTKLARLVEQAKDFAAFFRAVSDDIGGEKESKVATDVVQFLEMRRDAAI